VIKSRRVTETRHVVVVEKLITAKREKGALGRIRYRWKIIAYICLKNRCDGVD
jgi:hypothetical protein